MFMAVLTHWSWTKGGPGDPWIFIPAGLAVASVSTWYLRKRKRATIAVACLAAPVGIFIGYNLIAYGF
jgi:hypothetical protein